MDLLRGIYSYGFEKPSVIQQKAILPVLEGHDTIAQAQSGRPERRRVTVRYGKDRYFLHCRPSDAGLEGPQHSGSDYGSHS